MGWGRSRHSSNGKGAVKGVTGTVGNAVGGVVNTTGDALGSVGRGVGQTVNKTTGTRSGGNAIKDGSNDFNHGVGKIGNGIERGSKGKNPRSPWSRFKSRTRI